MITIVESGMTFGPFEDNVVYRVETSPCYLKVNAGNGSVNTAEFMLLRANKELWVVEAKSSAPQPTPQSNFEAFLCEIRDKFRDTLQLFAAQRIGRHPEYDADIPASISALNLATAKFKFVLVMGGNFKDEWLIHLQNALPGSLRSTTKIWGLPPNSVSVINRSGAVDKGLIQV